MITSAFKDRLMGALHTSVQYFNHDNDPNKAILKTAEENNFNIDQTTRLVEMFNTARTIYHYKTAADRTVPFSLADSTVIIPALFEPKEKAAAPIGTGHDYSGYDKPEAHYEDGMLIDKTGVQEVSLGTPTKYSDTNLEAQAARAQTVISVQHDLANTARSEANISATKAAQILGKTAKQLTSGYEEDVKDQYSRLFGGYARAVEYGPVMAKLGEFIPDYFKAAVSKDAVIDDRDLGEYLILLKEARDWMQAEAEMLALAGELDKEASAFEIEWKETIAPLFPQQKAKFGKAAQLIHIAQSQSGVAPISQWVTNKNNDKTGGKSEGLSGLINNLSGSAPVAAIQGGIRKGYEQALASPATAAVEGGIGSIMQLPRPEENRALSEQLKDVQRKLLLEDLMTNDPVLSEENPQTVVDAYSAVLNLAPEVAANKEVIRAILRQVVHSVAIGAYDAQSWTELEKNLRNIAGKTDARGVPTERD